MTENAEAATETTPVSDAEGRAVEQFLYRDADLLDGWRLHEWLATVAPDGHYLVPTTDRLDGHPDDDLFLVSDDRFLLEQRVNSLLTRAAHAEYPHSRTTRLVTNVQARRRGEVLDVTANFAIFRTRPEVFDTYVGRYRLLLVPDEEHGFLFRERRVELALDSLRPQGKVSVIL